MGDFDFAAAIAQRPGGATRAELVAFYGDPTAGCTRTGKGCFEPPASFRRNMVKIPLSELPGFPEYAVPGTKISGVTFHARVAPVFRATWAELRRRGLTDKLRTYDGAVTYRHMLWNYSNPVSLHAYGAAIDLDARWNGYNLPHAQMQINREVVRCFEECGWEWGGRWRSSDGMHFQWTDPLPGVRQAEWRDAMARGRPASKVPGFDAPPLTIPATPPKAMPDVHYIRGWGRDAYTMQYRTDLASHLKPGERVFVSIATDADGRVLVGKKDGKERIVILSEAEATARGFK